MHKKFMLKSTERRKPKLKTTARSGIATVSYTHLDVYKRQGLHIIAWYLLLFIMPDLAKSKSLFIFNSSDEDFPDKIHKV